MKSVLKSIEHWHNKRLWSLQGGSFITGNSVGYTDLYIDKEHTIHTKSGLLTFFYPKDSYEYQMQCAVGGEKYVKAAYRRAKKYSFKFGVTGDYFLIV